MYPLGLLGNLQSQWGLSQPMGLTMPVENPPGLLGGMNPRTMGLLSTAAGLLQAAGPNPRPVSTGQALGGAAMQGLGAYQNAQQQNIQNQYYGAMMASHAAKAKKAERDLEREGKRDEALRSRFGEGSEYLPDSLLGSMVTPRAPYKVREGEGMNTREVTYRDVYDAESGQFKRERIGEGSAFRPPSPLKPTFDVLANDRGQPTGVFVGQPNGGWTLETLPGNDDLGGLPPNLEVPTASLDKMAQNLGPYKRMGEAWDKTVGALMGWKSDPDRDASRTQYSEILGQLASLRRLPGARSNMALSLALNSLPSTGVFENPDRARNVLNQSFGTLQSAYEEAVRMYQQAPDKKSAQDARELAEQIKSVFDSAAALSAGSGSTGGEIERNILKKFPPGSTIRRVP